MTEEYLQFIWANKRVPVEPSLTTQQPVHIRNFGVHNRQLSGPDFFCGEILIDEIRLCGNIEIHVKSSDWYRHRHDQDAAYDNVVLHVVYEDDQPVMQNGRYIPTLELKGHIDWEHYRNFCEERFRRVQLACSATITELDPIYLESMKGKAVYQKLQEKIKLLICRKPDDAREAFYQLFASAFGTSVNKHAFEHLASNVSLRSINHLSPFRRYHLLVGESGIIQAETSPDKTIETWHFKGTRPQNFPSIRVRQFAHLSASFNFQFTMCQLDVSEIVKLFRARLREAWSARDTSLPAPTVAFENQLLINAVAPYLWYQGVIHEDERQMDQAFRLLQSLPPEQNAVIQQWKSFGLIARNALDSQGLLALDRYYCCRKKCLSCEVGTNVLNRSE